MPGHAASRLRPGSTTSWGLPGTAADGRRRRGWALLQNPVISARWDEPRRADLSVQSAGCALVCARSC